MFVLIWLDDSGIVLVKTYKRVNTTFIESLFAHSINTKIYSYSK